MDDIVLPELEELGIEPVETGIMDAPANDTAAVQANVNLIAERFKAADADTVLIVGLAGANWPLYMDDDPVPSEAPVHWTSPPPRAFGTNAVDHRHVVLDGSLSGGGYGPDQARYDEAAMQECVAMLEAAGVEAPPPSEFDVNDRSNQPYQAAFQACPDMALVQAWLEAAGEDLNYGTLEAAIDGLEVSIPGDPTRAHLRSAAGGRRQPEVYFFTWNSIEQGIRGSARSSRADVDSLRDLLDPDVAAVDRTAPVRRRERRDPPDAARARARCSRRSRMRSNAPTTSSRAIPTCRYACTGRGASTARCRACTRCTAAAT